MSFSLLPDLIIESLSDLRPEMLSRRGILLLMLDFDNTIVPYTSNQPSKEVEQWFSLMDGSGIRLCVVSNSRKSRVQIFCDSHGIPCIRNAKKPFWRCGIREALDRFGVKAEKAALVGDQIYTDVLGGNGAGLTTILVRPICLHTIWLKLRNVAEQPFIFLGKRRMKHEKS